MSFFKRIKEAITAKTETGTTKFVDGLTKTRDAFTQKMEELILRRRKIDDQFFEELEEILIASDVGVTTVMDLIDDLRAEVRKRKIEEAAELKPILMEKISGLLTGGGDDRELRMNPSGLTVILFVGVNGVGKTTTIGKMAHLFKQEGRKVLMAAGDTFRAGAIEQLEVWGQRVGVDVIKQQAGSDPAAVMFDAIQAARTRQADILLCDTAGRLQNKSNLMDELNKIYRVIRREIPDAPHETLLVIDAMTGQEAVNVAESFHAQLELTGIILSRLDGDIRGGAALSVKSVTGCPIKFASMGEKLDSLEPFHPERMASRILGMGDMLSLIEKAQSNIDAEKAAEMERKMRNAEFTFEDFLEQMEQVKKLGPIDQLLDMLPGANKMKGMKDLKVDDKQMGRVVAIVKSMTKEEKLKPELLNASRRKRIAAGSGTTIQDVNRLIKQFDDMRKMIDGYDCGIRYMDDHLGTLFKALEDQGVMEELIIIISADHGENMGQLGIYGEHATADQGTCRIPMIIRWPGMKQGIVDDGLHYHLDLLPTLAEMVGNQPTPDWHGKSFAPALKEGAECGRDYLVVSQCAHVAQRAVRFRDWIYIRTYHDGLHLFDEDMLYNLAEDPKEQFNVAAEHRELCYEAVYYLNQWHDDMMRRNSDAVDPLWTVMKEGGPFHAKGYLRNYMERLQETGRGHLADELRRRHPAEFPQERSSVLAGFQAKISFKMAGK